MTDDIIEQAKLRDTRFAVLANAIALEADLRDNATIKALVLAVRQDAEQAMTDLSETAPADTLSISLQLVKIRTLVYIRNTLNVILRQGAAAEAAIRAEDQRNDGGE